MSDMKQNRILHRSTSPNCGLSYLASLARLLYFPLSLLRRACRLLR